MRKLLAPIHYLIRVQENRPAHTLTFMAFIFFVGVARVLEEGLFFRPAELLLRNGFNNTVFYFSMLYGTAGLLRLFLRVSPGKLLNIVLIGLFLGLFPPLIDGLLGGFSSGAVLYRYERDFFTVGWKIPEMLFFYSPERAFPIGESITVWLTIMVAVYYCHYKGAGLFRTILFFLLFYLFFQFQARLLPSVIGLAGKSLGVRGREILEESDLVLSFLQIIPAFLGWILLYPEKASYLKKRSNHILPFLLLTAIGARVSFDIHPLDVWPVVLVYFLFVAALVHNDFADRDEDRSQGRPQLYSRDDVHFFFLLAGLLVLVSSLFEKLFVLPGVLILAVSFLYSSPHYRAKRYFPGNLKIEGVWGLSAYLMGMFGQGVADFPTLALTLAPLVFLGWSGLSALKDAKDIRADHRAGNRTLFVLAYQRGWGLSRVYRWYIRFYLVCFLTPSLWFAAQGFWTEALVCLLPWPLKVWFSRFFPSGRNYEIQLGLTSLFLVAFLISIPPQT